MHGIDGTSAMLVQHAVPYSFQVSYRRTDRFGCRTSACHGQWQVALIHRYTTTRVKEHPDRGFGKSSWNVLDQREQTKPLIKRYLRQGDLGHYWHTEYREAQYSRPV